MALKKGVAKGLYIVLAIIAVVGFSYWWKNRSVKVDKAQDIGSIALPTDPKQVSLSGDAEKLPLPGTDITAVDGPNIDIYEMAWAAQTSVNLANGGLKTTKGSLFEKAGLNVNIVYQNDDGKTKDEFVSWLKQYHDHATNKGFFIVDMGSQMDWYMGAIDSVVKALKYGKEYEAVIFDAVGKSYGEDQMIATTDLYDSIKADPQVLRGKVVRGVKLGGDLDIAIKFAGDNGIPVNANDAVYDPTALNLSYTATDFMQAVVDYNSSNKDDGGMTETRKLIRNGKTWKDTAVHFSMVATWFPGDINAIEGAGGGTVISTRQYGAIMPAVVITCKKYLQDNEEKIKNFIAAHTEAGDQVRSFGDAKQYALDLDAKIFQTKDGKWWATYFDGKKKGKAMLGGSMVYNLNDLVNEFGLSGNTDIYKIVYNTFYDVHAKLYPVEMKGAPLYDRGVDKSYMLGVVNDSSITNKFKSFQGKAFKVDYTADISNKIASKAVSIEFATGSDVIQSSSYTTLRKIANDLVASDGLKGGVYGHTDNTGDPNKNQTLSESRAESVKRYLIEKCSVPAERLESKGFGDSQPLHPDLNQNIASTRQENRRVEIALGN